MKLRAAALGTGAVGVLLLGGCGGSSHRPNAATGPVGAPLTFSEQLNAICKPANHQMRLGGRTWVAEEQGYLTKLRALAPPRSEQPTYAKFLASFQTVIDGFGANKPAALRAVVTNANLRQKLHAPGCGLPGYSY